MTKLVLQVEDEIDFMLFCIACHKADYRLCFELNKALGIDLDKQDNYEIETKPREKDSYSMYYYNDEENYREMFLIANKSENSILIPEQKQVDYFLQVYGYLPDYEVKEVISKINAIPLVLTAFQVDPEKLKSKQLLIH